MAVVRFTISGSKFCWNLDERLLYNLVLNSWCTEICLHDPFPLEIYVPGRSTSASLCAGFVYFSKRRQRIEVYGVRQCFADYQRQGHCP